jgi:hypothetical protein
VKTDLVYEDGDRADMSTGVYLHHVFQYNMAPKPLRNWINTYLSNAISSLLGNVGLSTIIAPLSTIGNAGMDEYLQ